MHHAYMLERTAVNALTAEFTRVLRDGLAQEFKDKKGDSTTEKEIGGLYIWLQERVFQASTTAFLGSRILEIYPNLREDFFEFDRHMLTMFFGVPRILNPTPYNVRERVVTGMIRYQKQMQEESNGQLIDPDGDIDWEPMFGSRANRARQRYYSSRGMNLRARAGMDLGLLFALSSNAIPAAGWMLMHILNPQGDPSLYSRVMLELEKAERDDDSLEIPILVSSPLLQSIYHEVLRLYMDIFITRELKADLTLPLDETGTRQVLLQKNSIIMAPSWLGHRDEELWTNHPASNSTQSDSSNKTQRRGKRFSPPAAQTGNSSRSGAARPSAPAACLRNKRCWDQWR